MKGGRLKCRYCAFRAPNPSSILNHLQAEHPGYWRNITHKAKQQTMSLYTENDPQRKRPTREEE